MDCFYCGQFQCSQEAHDSSVTHFNKRFNFLLSQRENKRNLKLQEQLDLEKEIMSCKIEIDQYNKKKDFECGGAEDSSCNKTFDTMEEAISHEKDCLKFSYPVVSSSSTKTKNYVSDLSLTCENCEKVFHHTKLHPKYALNRHLKTCEGNKSKNCKTLIRNFANTATQEQLLEVANYLKKFNF
jgi:hypothetical protein